MAKMTLPVNFKDDIMSSNMGGKRRYKPIQNEDGTISLEDVTNYEQIGSDFNAAQVNQTNAAVNASADAGKIIDSMDTIRATTKSGYMAGALAVKQLDKNLIVVSENMTEIGGKAEKINVYVDSDGKLHFVDSEGADTVLNFNHGTLQKIADNISSINFERDYYGQYQHRYTFDISGLGLGDLTYGKDFVIAWVNAYSNQEGVNNAGIGDPYRSHDLTRLYTASSNMFTNYMNINIWSVK